MLFVLAEITARLRFLSATKPLRCLFIASLVTIKHALTDTS
ncbi:hypothetical protein SynMITS9220_01854 [Synechococcus sp. MIT S9220]|nr:hypothetical protein SynMITS9220_01854 [Synechococcus sp. MIT S9220]